MTTRRAVTYAGLSCLAAAWLASAASTTFQEPAPRAPEPRADAPRPQDIAADVQMHAARLRERLSAAPVPQAPLRNPFHFDTRAEMPARQIARRVEAARAPEPPPPPAEPALSLIGVAEDRGAQGVVRTAIVAAGPDELFMVTAGQTILGRYRVERVGADAVELRDLTTDVVRRLVLK